MQHIIVEFLILGPLAVAFILHSCRLLVQCPIIGNKSFGAISAEPSLLFIKNAYVETPNDFQSGVRTTYRRLLPSFRVA